MSDPAGTRAAAPESAHVHRGRRCRRRGLRALRRAPRRRRRWPWPTSPAARCRPPTCRSSRRRCSFRRSCRGPARSPRRAARTSTPTRSRCGSSRSRSCRPASRRRRLGLRSRGLREEERAPPPQRALAHDRGEVESAGPGQVDQRPRRREREPPPAPPAGRPDAALGEPARRRGGARLAADLRRRPRAPTTAPCRSSPMCTAPSASATRATATPRRGTCRRPPTSPPATRRRARGTTSSPARRRTGYGAEWGPGFATFQYPNDQRASTIWYHDHTLGMTRLNVYAGPAGFFLIRGGPDGDDACSTAAPARRPCSRGPPRRRTTSSRRTRRTTRSRSPCRTARSTTTGRCSTPTRGRSSTSIVGDYIPVGEFSPIWNPEFFGNMLIANGTTWPFQVVEQRRYRLRFLNGCQSQIPHPRLRRHPGRRGLADRQRGRLPRRAGEPDRRPRRPPPDGARPSGPTSSSTSRTCRWGTTCSATSAPTSRSAAASPASTSPSPTRTRRARCSSSASSPRRRPTRRRRRSSSCCPRSHRFRRSRVHPPARAHREVGDRVRRERRSRRGTRRGAARHGRRRCARRVRVGGPGDREPGGRLDRGLGVRQHHGRRAPHARARGRVRGGRPRGTRARPRGPDDIVVPFQPDGDVSAPSRGRRASRTP